MPGSNQIRCLRAKKLQIVSKSRKFRTRLFRGLYLTAAGIDLIEGEITDKSPQEIKSVYKGYNLKNIRTLLNEGFTNEELRRLCYDEPEFRPVYDELAQETGKAKIIDRLLEYAERKLLLDHLLALVKEHSPARYEKHQPYHS